MGILTTTTVQLSLTDTWPAILEKLEQAPGRRVVFVVPRRNTVLRSVARVRALRNAAVDAGKRVALVTHDADVVDAARLAGVPTFGSAWRARWLPWWHGGPRRLPRRPTDPALAYQAAQATAPLPKRGPARHRSLPHSGSALAATDAWWFWFQAFLATLIVGGIIVLAGALVLLLAPTASVVLKPAPESINVSLNLSAHPGIDKPDVGLGVVPARYVETLVEDTVYVPTTGSRLEPEAKATGKVVFTNLVDQEVRIPKGTRVRTATGTAVVFVTTEDATLPAQRGARVEVPIEAERPGPQGNVRAFTISQIGGALALQVSVTNPEPTSGGGLTRVAVVTPKDKEAAHAEALRVLTEKAAAELAKRQQPGEFIPRESLQTFVMAETYDHFSGEKADRLGVRMRLLMRGVAVDGNAARELALRKLRDQLPPAGRLVRDTTHVSIGPVTAYDPTTHTVYFAAKASGIYVLDINESEVRSAIAGKPIQEAAVIMQKQWHLAAPPEIYLGPDWLMHQKWIPRRWRERMPAQPGRILVTVDLEGALREANAGTP